MVNMLTSLDCFANMLTCVETADPLYRYWELLLSLASLLFLLFSL